MTEQLLPSVVCTRARRPLIVLFNASKRARLGQHGALILVQRQHVPALYAAQSTGIKKRDQTFIIATTACGTVCRPAVIQD